MDKTATGLCGRLLLGHSVRPSGVGWMPEPGRRIVIKTVPKDVSRFIESDLARASTLTLTGSAAEVVDQVSARFNPRCRFGVRCGPAGWS